MVRLAVLLLGASLAMGSAHAQTPQTGTAPAAKPAPAAPADAGTKTPLVDINTASKDGLDKLPGIGPARAEIIIKNRPYNGKDELRRKKVLPDSVYEGIRERIIARQS